MKKKREGVVLSNRMQKTVVVQVERVFLHKQFHKVVKSYVKFKAHDEGNKCKIGDRVRIEETRPLSKGKRWEVVEIVGHAKVVERIRPGRLHKVEEDKGAEPAAAGVGNDPGTI